MSGSEPVLRVAGLGHAYFGRTVLEGVDLEVAARALAPEPDVVFFDEPFTALDVALKRRMQDIVIAASAAARLSGLFITHDLIDAARIANRIAVMHPDGRGISGTRAVPGRRGTGADAALFDWVQRALAGDSLFRHIHDVDARRLA